MSSSIRTAVILAAGLGSRLGNIKENKPKAFVKIGGESLIERSIQLLVKKGINNIIIGTGYLSEEFDALKDKFPQVSTCRNPDYEKTGSMYTLFVLKELVNEPFLLLEGDLLYESAALDYLLNDKNENIILASDATQSGDEVFIQCNDRGMLQQMSKERASLSYITGELVGISKLSIESLEAMCAFANSQYERGNREIHYEDAMVGISNEVDLFVRVIEDLAWCEIDDPSHFERANSVVYPKIIKREQK